MKSSEMYVLFLVLIPRRGGNLEGGQIKMSGIKVVKFVKESDVYLYKSSYKQTNCVQGRSRTIGTFVGEWKV